MTLVDTHRCPTCRREFDTKLGLGRHRSSAHGWVPPHGTTSRYTNQLCRCAKCCAANTKRTIEYYHRTGRSRPRDEVNAERRAQVRHGSRHMYKAYGCRCNECRAWSRAERQRFRTTKRPRNELCLDCGRSFASLAMHRTKLAGTCA